MGAKLEVEVRAEALILRGSVLSSQLGPFTKLVTEIVTQPSFPDSEIRKLKSEVISGFSKSLAAILRSPAVASRAFCFAITPTAKPYWARSRISKTQRRIIARN